MTPLSKCYLFIVEFCFRQNHDEYTNLFFS